MADRGIPPGRAGRLRLRERLVTAERAATLLDRKLRILRERQDRYHRLSAQTRDAWEHGARQARTWYDRAALLCGEAELRLSTVDGQAGVDVEWVTLTGLRHPASATCHLPAIDPAGHAPGSAALVTARYAYRAALEAAVAHAAALAAARALDAEVAQTRRVVRAIVTGRLPRLTSAVRELSTRIDEAERADLVRLRWAAGRGQRSGFPRSGSFSPSSSRLRSE